MQAEELARYDGLGLADLVRRREVSASELLDASIARVEALNPEINAVLTRLYDQARAAIAAGGSAELYREGGGWRLSVGG